MSTSTISARMRAHASKLAQERYSRKWMEPAEWEEYKAKAREERIAKQRLEREAERANPTLTLKEWRAKQAKMSNKPAPTSTDEWSIVAGRKKSKKLIRLAQEASTKRKEPSNSFSALAKNDSEKPRPKPKWQQANIPLRSLRLRNQPTQETATSETISQIKPSMFLGSKTEDKSQHRGGRYQRGWVGRVARVAGCLPADAQSALLFAEANPDTPNSSEIIAAAMQRHPQIVSREKNVVTRSSFPAFGAPPKNVKLAWGPAKDTFSKICAAPAKPLAQSSEKKVHFAPAEQFAPAPTQYTDEDDEYFSDDSYSEHFNSYYDENDDDWDKDTTEYTPYTPDDDGGWATWGKMMA